MPYSAMNLAYGAGFHEYPSWPLLFTVLSTLAAIELSALHPSICIRASFNFSSNLSAWYDASSVQSLIALQPVLRGQGFHRELVYRMSRLTGHLATCPCGTSISFMQLSDGPNADVYISQHLPPGIFADPYQLHNMHQLTSSAPSGPTVKLRSEVDVESTERYAHPQVLLVHHPFELRWGTASYTAAKSSSGQVQETHVGEITLPLHARYPLPIHGLSKSFKLLLLGPYSQLTIPPPTILLFGLHAVRVETCCLQANESDGPDMLWTIPAGNLAHSSVTAWLPACVSALGCLSLVLTALRTHSGQSDAHTV